jgi:Domain of unknown function (DUF4336)
MEQKKCKYIYLFLNTFVLGLLYPDSSLVGTAVAFTSIPRIQPHSTCATSKSIVTKCALPKKNDAEFQSSEIHKEFKLNDLKKQVTVDSAECRRSFMTKSIIAAAIETSSILFTPPAHAVITRDSNWPLWLSLPVAPYSKRKTIRYQIAPGVWCFDQLIGIYYVHVPIRMTVVTKTSMKNGKRIDGLLVYAPVAPTRECLYLLQELIDQYGPIQDIILPSVAVEHKVNAGPFARAFPEANFYVTDKQYSFPLNLPDSFLGLPSWTKSLPQSSVGEDGSNIWGGDLEHDVLTVKPGIGSMYQDVAMFHKSSQTLLVCDAIFAVNGEPPRILTQEEEYTRALLFHARDYKDEIVDDTPSNRKKGWRRIVLLFNFFFPGSGKGDLGIGPIVDALKTPRYKDGWGGWKPFSWGDDEVRDFEVFSAKGKPTILPIIQIILSRDPSEVQRWLSIVTKWNFNRVIPMHLDNPLTLGPRDFEDVFDFVKSGKNEVRFCDEDVEFLRKAEEGPLRFSVYKSSLGTLRGRDGPCGLKRPS